MFRCPRHIVMACLETMFFFAVVMSGFIFFHCFQGGKTLAAGCLWEKWTTSQTPLEKIIKSRQITVITRNSATCYYLYRDQAMGFEYDLAKAFADFLGVDLKVQIAESWDRMVTEVMSNPQSFIAAGMIITPYRKNQVAFSNGYLATRQHFIVHRRNHRIRKIKDLIGKTVHVRRGTPYQESIEALRLKGIDIQLKLYDDVPTEELIRRVADGTIDITIANSNIARLNRRYYPQIMIQKAITEEDYLRWAVAPTATALQARMNAFIHHIQSNGVFEEIYQRYYAKVEDFDFVDMRAYHRRLKTRLPRYQKTIQNAAEMYGFDWRLIAAQIYQESHFNPMARSHAGAVGLMQLTENTANSLGVIDTYHPEENINAGVEHLKYLFDYFKEADGLDRLCITLAAYNIGQGHISDARRLAVQQRLDPNKWSSLAQTLPLLRYKKYYRNALYGYCRGTEPVDYVNQIMLYYDILKYKYLSTRAMVAMGP